MEKLQKIDLKTVKIKSKRLNLRAIEETDAKSIFSEFNSEITCYMYPSPASKIEETLAFIRMSQEEMERKENLQLVITNLKTGEFLGCCGLHHLNDPSPELGIWLKKSAQGSRLGREAITALVDWAKENTGYTELLYPVDKRNIPSRKIPESLGGVAGREFDEEGMAGNKLELVEYRIMINV